MIVKKINNINIQGVPINMRIQCEFTYQCVTKIGQYKSLTYKRRAETNVGPVQTSDGYMYKEKCRILVEREKRPLLSKSFVI